MQRFVQRVWREDVAPLLNDRRARQRQKLARGGAKAAAAGGLALDTLLRLRGRPFTRFFTVLGASWGALLPDVLDWRWLRAAREDEVEALRGEVARRLENLSDEEALAMFDLASQAGREELQAAWRKAAQRWHPDKAPDDAARREHQLRFLVLKEAHTRLTAAYDAGRLPR